MINKRFMNTLMIISLLFFVIFSGAGCGGGGGGDSDYYVEDDPDVLEAGSGILNEIVIGYGKGDNPKYVTQNLTLPTKIYSSDIAWTSEPSIIASNGTVTRQAADTDVTLTAAAIDGDTQVTRDFNLKVIKRRIRDNSNIQSLPIETVSSGDINITRNASGDVQDIEGNYANFDIENADDAIDAITAIKDELGIKNPIKELEPAVITSDRYGAEYQFRQVHNGVPVFGRALMASANAGKKGDFMHSNLLPSEVIAKADGKNDIGKSAAEAAAKAAYTGNVEVDSERTEKIIYSIGDYENEPVYAYVIGVYDSEYNYISETVVVNAENGEIISKLSNISFNMVSADGVNEFEQTVSFDVNRNIHFPPYYIDYEMLNTELHVAIYKDNLLNTSINSLSNTWTDPEAVSAYTNMCEIMQWWKTRFGRDSLNDKGWTVNVYIHSKTKVSDGTIEDNAMWDHDFSSLLYGKLLPFVKPFGLIIGEKKNFKYSPCADIDVLTHETTHGVLRYIAHPFLLFSNEADLAFDEGYADIFACIKAQNWKHGENSGIVYKGREFECFRNLKAPYDEYSLAGYQLKVLHKDVNSDSHLGGLLYVGHAAYLMHKDNNNDYGLTWDELGEVWYKSMSMGLSCSTFSISKLQDVRRCVVWAAQKIGLSSEKLAVIKAAFDEVGIKAQKANFGTIYGVVTDSSDKTPLEDVRVSAYEQGFNDNGKIVPKLAGSTSTTEVGGYFLQLEAGKYFISFDKTGYEEKCYDISINSSDRITLDVSLVSTSIEENQEKFVRFFGGHTYAIFDDGMDWNAAKAFCENLGGYLAIIESAEEQKIIEELLNLGEKNSYWLGAEKDSSGKWHWLNGNSLSYTNWGSGQPDNYTKSENKLMVYRRANPRRASSLGKWNDLQEDGKCGTETFFGVENFGVICEWDSIITRTIR